MKYLIVVAHPWDTGTDTVSVWAFIMQMTGANNSSAFQHLEENIKRETLTYLKDNGASLRQLERLTGISKSYIHRL